ncbi:ParA family protein [Aeromonas dhakensis]|uniref:ParA family protein n=1 Tax=Aeromonas dhakensis TaxID=196024 RepID=UPI003BA38E9E
MQIGGRRITPARMNIDKIIARQQAYYAFDARDFDWSQSSFSDAYPDLKELLDLELPKYSKYAICNLRGGIGKSTLVFNLTYDADDILAIDTCAQGNSSSFFGGGEKVNGENVYDALIPWIVPGAPWPQEHIRQIDSTNNHFAGHNAWFIPSSQNLYEFPSTLEQALNTSLGLPEALRARTIARSLTSLKSEAEKAMRSKGLNKCLIDTSPFFSGATHLAWHAADALIVPVRTDQQSVDSLEMVLQMLDSQERHFQRWRDIANLDQPKIQLVVVTHCGWSTVQGAMFEPNNQTQVFLKRVKALVQRYIHHFTTDDPDNHIAPLDDFLGSGRISSAQAIPIRALRAGQKFTISGQPVEVNASVNKCKRQLSFISTNIWDDVLQDAQLMLDDLI